MRSILIIIIISFRQILASSLFYGVPTDMDTTVTVISDTTLTDTSSAVPPDSLQRLAVTDTLKPIFQRSFSPVGFAYEMPLTKKTIDKFDYRFAGDLFSYYRTGFHQDLGSAGQPGEIYLYGYGYGNISYLADGIPLNNRILNSFDLNKIQSEYIDSVEILPLPRGFVYDNYNNPVSVNFIMRDSISKVPTSRLRYYQGSDDEGYIDALFSAYLINRLNGSFQVTHAGIDSRYQSSESSLWKASVKLRYMPSNFLNIIGSYSYFDSNVDLNGGVDIDSIRNNVDPGVVNEILYSNFQAPVNYTSRYQKETSHLYNLKLLGKIFTIAPTELDLFLNNSVTQFRQNEYRDMISQPDIPVIVHDNKFKSYGAKLRQLLLLNPLKIDLLARYERSEYDSPMLKYNDQISSYSLAAKIDLKLLDGLLVPSVYGKYLNHSGRTYRGYGADINLNLSDQFNLFAGLSRFEKPYSAIEEQYLNPSVHLPVEELSVYEIGAGIQTNNIRGSVSYFAANNQNQLYPVIELYTDTLKINEAGFFNRANLNNHGANINFDLHFWKVLFSVNASYFSSKLGNVGKLLPEFSGFAGIYYVDTLFNDNLKLKTGFNFRITGSQNYSTYDFEKSRRIFFRYDPADQSTDLLKDEMTENGYQLDFFLAGLVQDRATLYFVYQNILGTDYYIVPFYPKQYRGIRLGLAWEFLD